MHKHCIRSADRGRSIYTVSIKLGCSLDYPGWSCFVFDGRIIITRSVDGRRLPSIQGKAAKAELAEGFHHQPSEVSSRLGGGTEETYAQLQRMQLWHSRQGEEQRSLFKETDSNVLAAVHVP